MSVCIGDSEYVNPYIPTQTHEEDEVTMCNQQADCPFYGGLVSDSGSLHMTTRCHNNTELQTV